MVALPTLWAMVVQWPGWVNRWLNAGSKPLGLIGCAKQSGVLVGHDKRRDLGHHRLIPALGLEGFSEETILENRRDFWRDAATDVDAARGKKGQSQVAGQPAQDGAEKVQGHDANGILVCEGLAYQDLGDVLVDHGGSGFGGDQLPAGGLGR